MTVAKGPSPQEFLKLLDIPRAPNAAPYDAFYHPRGRIAGGFEAMGFRVRPAAVKYMWRPAIKLVPILGTREPPPAASRNGHTLPRTALS